MKNPIILFSVMMICICSTICGQEPIDIYEGEMPSHTLADWYMIGPVKKVSITLFTKKDSTLLQDWKQILTFDSTGHIFTRKAYRFNNKDSTIEYYQYDSLNRISARFSSDNSFRQDFVYDASGYFSYCVYTRGNGKPDTSWRYYYNEKGRCTYREYIPGIDEDYLGYTIYQHSFQYDSMNHCVEKVAVLDGDTETVTRLKYDVRGNITEDIHYGVLGGEVYDLMQYLYFYDDEGRLVKSQTFMDHAKTNETFYEYNDLNQLICGKSYNEEGYLSPDFVIGTPKNFRQTVFR